MQDGIVKEGYLTKRAIRSGRNWKRRYFVASTSSLSYYKSKVDFKPGAKPRGVIALKGNTHVRASNAGTYCFEVATDRAVLFAKADSELERASWMDNLNRIITAATNSEPTGQGVQQPARTSSMLGRVVSAGAKRLSGGFMSVSAGGEGRTSNAPKRKETHTFTASGTKFEVDKRYSFMRPIGHGAYGVVVSAMDSETGETVAIKKVTRAFEDLVDAKRILREIKLLRHFDHENIIHVKDLMLPRSIERFEDIYIVSELMETDLHRVIYSRQKLTDDHVQYFIYQILRAMKYIHSANVLHRDLKPSNLLLNSNCDLKVCDFGLARGVEDDNLQLTEYVVTRWYRAPEIMLTCRTYTKAIDVWSIGCIFAELLGRKPLFPGEDYIHQLQIIVDMLGTPSESDLHFITSEKARRFMRNQPLRRKKSLAKQYPRAPSKAIDLMERMLRFDPEKRISVTQALEHPYLAGLHHPDDEPLAERPFEFADDVADDDLDKRTLQIQIYEEIVSFRPAGQPELEKAMASLSLKGR